MRIIITYELEDAILKDIHSHDIPDNITINGLILKQVGLKFYNVYSTEYYNNLSIENKFYDIIIPDVLNKRRFFVIHTNNHDKRLIIDDFVTKDSIVYSIEEARNMIINNIDRVSDKVKDFF